MIVWLASYPRSGNTFLRIILNHVFGLKTYSAYNDLKGIGADKGTTEIVGHQFLPTNFQITNAATDEKLWLIKTHEYPIDTSKAVYIIRNGREAITSYFFYFQHIVNKNVSLKDIIKGDVIFGSWSTHLDAWRPLERANTLFLPFEGLINKPTQYFTILAQFLDTRPISTHMPNFAELQKINPKFFRSGQNDTWKTIFSKEDDELFCKLHSKAMVQYGYGDFLNFKHVSNSNV